MRNIFIKITYLLIGFNLINFVGCVFKAKIVLSNPQVFTRERLVKERFEEQQWLKGKLNDVPTKSSIQGLIDFRQLKAFHNHRGEVQSA